MNNLVLKSIIYGGIDGIITIFNLIAGMSGANINNKYILILGIALLISDGLSMGIGDYLSIKAQNRFNHKNNYLKYNNGVKNGFITFIFFVIFGSLPLIMFILINTYSKKNNFIKIYLLCILSLFILGIFQSIILNENKINGGINVSFFGGSTAILAYLISNFFSKLINNKK